MTTNANRTTTPRGRSVAYELDHSWNPIGYPWLVRVGPPYVAFSLMVGTAVLFHRHLYLHQIDSHSSWPKLIYVAFQVGLAPLLTLKIGQLTKDKIGHQAWEVLLPATLNIAFFWLVFEIYVRSLPVGTTFDARVRTWAFFLILLIGPRRLAEVAQ